MSMEIRYQPDDLCYPRATENQKDDERAGQ
jgi:hypothetical protein